MCCDDARGSTDGENNAVVVETSSKGIRRSPFSDRVDEPRKKRKTSATGTVSKEKTEQVLVYCTWCNERAC